MIPLATVEELQALSEAHAALPAQLPSAGAELTDWLAFFDRWELAKRALSGACTRLHYMERCHQEDEEVRARMDFIRSEVVPRRLAVEAELRGAWLACAQAEAIEAHFGPRLGLVHRLAQASFSPENQALKVEESKLTDAYGRKLGAARLACRGAQLNLTQVVDLLSNDEASVRREAWDALMAYMEAEAEDFHRRYDELLAVRQRMAENLGEPNFVALGYRNLGRSDYGPQEAALFRQEVLNHVVPVAKAWRLQQAKALGTPEVMPWDMLHHPEWHFPDGLAPVDGQLEGMVRLFEGLDPTLGEWTRRLVEGQLIDLEARPGKGAGAFCTGFADQLLPAIMCNSTGAVKDYVTLCHELGHAFQGWASMAAMPLMDIFHPEYAAAEVHSMGMEHLSAYEIGAVLDPEHAKMYRLHVLAHAIETLPYQAMVDGFQHWVYEHPGHTHAEREAAWDRLWREFMPGIEAEGMGHRTRWMRQPHLFNSPFYYIDYAIARTGAWQLWAIAEEDRAQALEVYHRLCALGGSKSLVAFFQEGGLKSPFEPGHLGPITAKVAQALGLALAPAA